MDIEVIRARKLLESKGYIVKKQLEFRGLDESDVVPLNEFLNMHGNEYAWKSRSLEETLQESYSEKKVEEYKVGDIIMPLRAISPQSGKEVSPHKILLIQSIRTGEDGIVKYRGFLLSSKVYKANKYGGYPNNIYIQDYASILYKGVRDHKEAFIRVDDIVEFTSEDLDTSGVWKGRASNAFFRFVNNCYNNYKQGISNKHRYWYSQRRNNYGQYSKEA